MARHVPKRATNAFRLQATTIAVLKEPLSVTASHHPGLLGFGPQINADETVTFRVWAPACRSLAIRLENPSRGFEMHRHEDGHFDVTTKASVGTRYWIELPDGKLRPDPASRFQPDGVHGPSQIVNTSLHRWKDTHWRGVSKENLIIYELHLGTLTKAGTYAAATQRLREIVELGATAIELMPLAQAAGARNWGYDGVNFFAPHHAYGTPEELQQFVDAAHQHDLAVLLDVVYNHFGPEGNYLHDFGGYISPTHTTPWGDAPNFDGEGSKSLRAFMIANAWYWVNEFHMDGLRLDAIHCMMDLSKPHIVTEIGQAFEAQRETLRRQIHLIGESNVYDPVLIQSLEQRGHGFDAIWCDDFLHSVFANLRPNEHMSHRRYVTHSDLQTTLTRGYVFQGGLNGHRERIPMEPHSPKASIESLIFAIQNHDFIGNHPAAARLHQLTSHDAQRAAAAILFLYPAIPMIFMGEEFASENPFLFFVDFGDRHLRIAVEEGRRREYPQHDWDNAPSPLSLEAFTQSYVGDRLEGDQATYRWYQTLIALRKEWQQAALLDARQLQVDWDEQNHLATLRYRKSGASDGYLLVRLHEDSLSLPPIEVELSETPLLLQGCSHSLDNQTLSKRIQMNHHGVLIGRGTAEI